MVGAVCVVARRLGYKQCPLVARGLLVDRKLEDKSRVNWVWIANYIASTRFPKAASPDGRCKTHRCGMHGVRKRPQDPMGAGDGPASGPALRTQSWRKYLLQDADPNHTTGERRL